MLPHAPSFSSLLPIFCQSCLPLHSAGIVFTDFRSNQTCFPVQDILEVGAAVVGVILAVPTAGASLAGTAAAAAAAAGGAEAAGKATAEIFKSGIELGGALVGTATELFTSAGLPSGTPLDQASVISIVAHAQVKADSTPAMGNSCFRAQVACRRYMPSTPPSRFVLCRMPPASSFGTWRMVMRLRYEAVFCIVPASLLLRMALVMPAWHCCRGSRRVTE